MSDTNLRSVLSGWHFKWYECWSDWMPWNIGRMNWRNFTLAHIDAEWSTSFPRSVNVTFVLFGLGFTLDWYQPHDVARLHTMRDRVIEEMEEGEEWKS